MREKMREDERGDELLVEWQTLQNISNDILF
jgi:hypothetical protein